MSGVTSWTFNIPVNQVSWVRVYENSDNSSGENCNTYDTTSIDMSVSLSLHHVIAVAIISTRAIGTTIISTTAMDLVVYDDDHGFGGHQDSGNHGVVEPGEHVHHTSQGELMMYAESSDDD